MEFQGDYAQIAKPLEGKFTREDLTALLKNSNPLRSLQNALEQKNA